MNETYKVIKVIPLLNIKVGDYILLDNNYRIVLNKNEKSAFSLDSNVVKLYLELQKNSFNIGDIVRNVNTHEIYLIKDILRLQGRYVIENLNDKKAPCREFPFSDDKMYNRVSLYYFVSVRKKGITIQKCVVGDDVKCDKVRKAMGNYFKTHEEATIYFNRWQE